MLRKIKRACLMFIIASSAIFLSTNIINHVPYTEVKSTTTGILYDPIWPSSLQVDQNAKF